MTGELFYQSALINMLLCLWLSSMVASVRMLSPYKSSASALLLGLSLGPVAIIVAFIYRLKLGVKISSVSLRSVFSIVLVSLLISGLFYAIFVANFSLSTVSSEVLFKNITIFVVSIGFIGGLLLALINLRVSFFESTFVVFFTSLLTLLLKDFVEEAFAYGTSVAYFSALIGSLTSLLLLFLSLGAAMGYLIFGEGRLNLRFGYESFIGMRFLMTKRSSQVVSLITVISVVAVMIACGGMIVVMSVMNGFSSDLRVKILGANAHLMVLKYGKDFGEYRDVIKKTKDIPGVKGAHAFIVNEGMVASKKNLSGAIITGIEVDQVKESGRLKYFNEEGLEYLKNPQTIPMVFEQNDEVESNQLPGAIIGKEMAVDLQAMVGDVISLISPVGDMGPTGPIPKAKPFRVAGLFHSGMYEFDSKFVYILLKDAQDFFGMGSFVTGVEYRVEDIDSTKGIAKEIDRAIGGYPFYTRDWMQMNRNMFSALQLEKIAMLIILATLIFMASLLILVTLIMVVMEKGKEIAILKSMGATDVSIMKIFVTYGLFVGSIGAISGGALGLGVCKFIEKVGIRLDPDIYYFSNLPVQIVTNEVLIVVATAILVSFLATVPPSLFAARLKPVEGLRYE